MTRQLVFLFVLIATINPVWLEHTKEEKQKEHEKRNEIFSNCVETEGTNITERQARKAIYQSSDDIPESIGCILKCILQKREKPLMDEEGNILTTDEFHGNRKDRYVECAKSVTEETKDLCDRAWRLKTTCFPKRSHRGHHSVGHDSSRGKSGDKQGRHWGRNRNRETGKEHQDEENETDENEILINETKNENE